MTIGNKKTLIRGVYLDGRREVQAVSQVPQNSKLRKKQLCKQV